MTFIKNVNFRQNILLKNTVCQVKLPVLTTNNR